MVFSTAGLQAQEWEPGAGVLVPLGDAIRPVVLLPVVVTNYHHQNSRIADQRAGQRAGWGRHQGTFQQPKICPGEHDSCLWLWLVCCPWMGSPFFYNTRLASANFLFTSHVWCSNNHPSCRDGVAFRAWLDNHVRDSMPIGSLGWIWPYGMLSEQCAWQPSFPSCSKCISSPPCSFSSFLP